MSNTWARNRYLDAISLGNKYSEYDWPHFPASVLNSTQREWQLGSLAGDGYGNVYCYVEYVDAAAATAGSVVALAPLLTPAGTIRSYITDSSVADGYISSDITGVTQNLHKNHLLLVDASAAANGFIGEIFWNGATDGNSKTKFQVKKTRHTEVGFPLGPGYPVNYATPPAPAVPTDDTYLAIMKNMFRVVLCDTNLAAASQTALAQFPVGTCLGGVSIGSTTSRYTWIQVFGIGPVKMDSNNSTFSAAGLDVIATTTDNVGTATAQAIAGTNVQANHLGFTIMIHTQVAQAGQWVPIFIDPYTRLR